MIKYLKNENFDEEVSKGTILVDFYADWCGPCKAMGSILEGMKDISVLKVNVDEHGDIAMRFGIMSIPTLLLYQDGKMVKKNVGLLNQDALEKWMK